MTVTYFPFDSGAGEDSYEDRWAKMAKLWRSTGVISNYLNTLETYGDSTGMRVKVKSGAAWIEGHYVESSAEEILTIDSSDATNPRIDLAIVRLDRTANTMALAVLKGTPAASPSAPTVTQNSMTWEIALAQVTVAAMVVTIAAANVSDLRPSSDGDKSYIGLIVALGG
jgi:hypothetical protein